MYIEGAWQIITLSSSDIKHTDLTIKLCLLHNYIPISASELHSMAVQVDFRDIFKMEQNGNDARMVVKEKSS